jgi:hypothetical protein
MSYLSHVLMENYNDLAVNAETTFKTGTAKRKAPLVTAMRPMTKARNTALPGAQLGSIFYYTLLKRITYKKMIKKFSHLFCEYFNKNVCNQGDMKFTYISCRRYALFFDDQLNHLKSMDSSIPMVHVPFGVANLRPAPES